jgi:hypothetical protein
MSGIYSGNEVHKQFEYRLQAYILGAQFLTAFGIGLSIPIDLNPPIQLEAVFNLFRNFSVNIHAFSERGFAPVYLETYLIALSILWIPFFTIYITLRPRSDLLPPLENQAKKLISQIFLVMFMLVASSLWWNPVVGEMQIGLLEGRFGAFLKFGLSSKIGASIILNLFFSTAPLVFFISLWSITSRPTK